jgi:16S rRNA (uracil1498-N3)-methyltransferase
VLSGAEGWHAGTVRRLGPGERVDLTDGTGQLAECMVSAARPGELELTVLARRTDPEPACPVVVAQALLKGDRAELAVELMTEVGVDEIVPWEAERCIARWRPDHREKALGRWRTAAVEAAKQSRRARFPVIDQLERVTGLAERAARARLAVLLDPAAGTPLAHLLPAGEPQPQQSNTPGRERAEIVLIVGPEGGISPAEHATLTRAGAVPARLGPTVLRGSTAGAVAAALVLADCGRWA